MHVLILQPSLTAHSSVREVILVKCGGFTDPKWWSCPNLLQLEKLGNGEKLLQKKQQDNRNIQNLSERWTEVKDNLRLPRTIFSMFWRSKSSESNNYEHSKCLKRNIHERVIMFKIFFEKMKQTDKGLEIIRVLGWSRVPRRFLQAFEPDRPTRLSEAQNLTGLWNSKKRGQNRIDLWQFIDLYGATNIKGH